MMTWKELSDVASMMAQYELHALFEQRAIARENGLSIWPSMEASFYALPALQAGLDQALDMLVLLDEYPELAFHIGPGGLPPQQGGHP